VAAKVARWRSSSSERSAGERSFASVKGESRQSSENTGTASGVLTRSAHFARRGEQRWATMSLHVSAAFGRNGRIT